MFGVLGFGLLMGLGVLIAALEGRHRNLAHDATVASVKVGLLISSSLTLLSIVALRSLCPLCLAALACILICYLLAGKPSLPVASRANGWCAIAAASLLSLSGIASVRNWDVLRAVAMRMPVSLVRLQSLSGPELIGSRPIASSTDAKRITYVGFYLVGCGGCAKSVRDVNALLRSKNARFVMRFIAANDSSDFRIAAAMQGLGGTSGGYQLALRYYGQDRLGDATVFGNSVDGLRLRPALERNYAQGAKAVRETASLAGKIGISAPPVVIRVVEGTLPVPVNPMTLNDYVIGD